MKDIDLDKLKVFINKHRNPVVSCSFGKDSLVVLHMIRQVCPNIAVIFNNTKVEYPETLQFKRRLKEEWSLNLIEIKPKDGWTFWKVIEKYGFPLGQRDGSSTNKCCYYLKKAPMFSAFKQYNWDLLIDGLTICESRRRYFNIKNVENFGYRFYKSWNCYKLSPIVLWTPQDVWGYIEKYKLPYNKFYDYEVPEYPELTKLGRWDGQYCRCLRVGCWSCTIPLKYSSLKLRHLRMFHPKLHNLLLRKGLGEILMQQDGMQLFKDRLDTEWIIETRPCLFDSIALQSIDENDED